MFKQSEGAVMSQKAQRRMANQKKVEVVWAGPAVVHEQCAVSRVPIGTWCTECGRLCLKIVMRAAVAALVMAVSVQLRVFAAVQRQPLGRDLQCFVRIGQMWKGRQMQRQRLQGLQLQ